MEQPSVKELAAIAKDAEKSLWWQFIESRLQVTQQEAQSNIDRLERELNAENQSEWIRWVCIKNTVTELLALRQNVIEAAKAPRIISALKDSKKPASQKRKNKGN